MMKDLKVFYFTRLGILLLGCFCLANANVSAKEPPNVLLIMTDDQGWGGYAF